jgi:hypothetical protein
MKNLISSTVFVLFFLLLTTKSSIIVAQTCNSNGQLRGKKPPPDQCNQENDSDCCVEGKLYNTYKCSPPVSGSTKATLTLNSFQKGGDGGGPLECDNMYHSDDTPVVALSTGWFNNKGRCLKYITRDVNKPVRSTARLIPARFNLIRTRARYCRNSIVTVETRSISK